MARQRPSGSSAPFTLSDADIVSERTVTRRGLLGTLGVAAGAALAGVVGTASIAEAADAGPKTAKKKKTKPAPKQEADSD